MSDAAVTGALAVLSMIERKRSGKPAWEPQGAWNIRPRGGYWGRTFVRIIDSDYKEPGLEIPTRISENPDEQETRTGADALDTWADLGIGHVISRHSDKTIRLYTEGHRLGMGEISMRVSIRHMFNVERGYGGIPTQTPSAFADRLAWAHVVDSKADHCVDVFRRN